MPPANPKNYAISPAATALGVGQGLGDQLAQQAQDTEEEIRRRMIDDSGLGMSASATTLLGPMKL